MIEQIVQVFVGVRVSAGTEHQSDVLVMFCEVGAMCQHRDLFLLQDVLDLAPAANNAGAENSINAAEEDAGYSEEKGQ